MNKQEYIDKSLELFDESEKALESLYDAISDTECDIDLTNNAILNKKSDIDSIKDMTEEEVEAYSWEDGKRKSDLSNNEKRSKEVEKRLSEDERYQKLLRDLDLEIAVKKEYEGCITRNRRKIRMLHERTANRRAILNAMSV